MLEPYISNECIRKLGHNAHKHRAVVSSVVNCHYVQNGGGRCVKGAWRHTNERVQLLSCDSNEVVREREEDSGGLYIELPSIIAF